MSQTPGEAAGSEEPTGGHDPAGEDPAAGSGTLVAPIVGVAVHPGSARVRRRGGAELAAGPSRLRVEGLPLGVERDSVRVSGHGPATVLGVEVSTGRHTDLAATDQRAALIARRRELDEQAVALGNEQDVLRARQRLLDGVVDHAGRTFATAIAAGTAEPDRLDALTGHVRDRTAAALAEAAVLARRRADLDRERDQVVRRLADLGATQPDRTTVTISLTTEQAGPGTFEIVYTVPGAHWDSRYDARLVGDHLGVDWYALVSQSTGEDWPACDLTVSTARPAGTLSIPDPEPWYVSEQPAHPVTPRGLPVPAAAPSPMAAEVLGAADAEPLTFARARVEHTLTAARYTVRATSPVPSDGSEHQRLIDTLRFGARVDRVSAPALDPEVYVRATVTNETEHTLPAGVAALFHEGEFVGSTRLRVWAPGEEVTLALGLDDRVRVERALLHRAVGKGLAGNRRHEQRYRTTVTNHWSRPVRVVVLDRVPVSRSAQISVRDVSLFPAAATDDLGRVRWELHLDPQQEQVLDLGFRVDSPRSVDVHGLTD